MSERDIGEFCYCSLSCAILTNTLEKLSGQGSMNTVEESPALILVAAIPFFSLSLFYLVFGPIAWLAGSQFPNQGLNPGHGSESVEP